MIPLTMDLLLKNRLFTLTIHQSGLQIVDDERIFDEVEQQERQRVEYLVKE